MFMTIYKLLNTLAICFCIWNEVKVRIIIFLFPYGYVTVLATLIGETVPSSLTCLGSVSENKWNIHMRVFYYTFSLNY